MRVIALVSLALALAASSMPLTTRADGGVSASKGESTGTLGNVVNPPGSGISSATGFGSSYASGSKNLGAGYQSGIGSLGTLFGGVGGLQSGSGSVTGSGSRSINPTRHSTRATLYTPTIDLDVADIANDIYAPASVGTAGSPPVDGRVDPKVSLGSGPVQMQMRAVTGSASGAGQATGGLGEIAGAAAGLASGASGASGGNGAGAVNSLSKSG